jgi:hypothetical protein
MDLLAKYPDIFKFIEEAYMDDADDIKREIEKTVKELTEINFGRIYEGIDFTKFREDIDIQKILKIITWTFEKLSEEELNKAKLLPNHEIDYPKVQLEAEQYFNVLTKVFYK